MLSDYDAHDPENGEFYNGARIDFASYVQGLLDEECGLNLSPGLVPCSHRWLLDEEGAMAGVVRVRHHIDTPFLANEAGHIGYDVPPAQRGRGFGVACLQAGLARAQELSVPRVLLCADAGNPASWRTIERCGGVLEREFHSNHYQCLVRRYWIKC
jgi:predicted acetyltransferase